ncbi:hypothetical protein L6R50_13670 [Myxococcota bacterium]|nr:hypothetical protein [Myxococcota bacterium]
MKVHDTGTFAAVRLGRKAEATDPTARGAGAAGATGASTRVSLSTRIAEVEEIRRMALAAPEVRPEVVAAARDALAAGSAPSVDSATLAGRVAADLGL